MITSEKRKYDRIQWKNLLSFEIIGSSGNTIDRSMGCTRNVSESGLLLETHLPVSQGRTVLVSIGFEEEIMELKGKIVYVRPRSGKRYYAGLEFFGIDRKDRRKLKRCLEFFEPDPTDMVFSNLYNESSLQ
ncbi:MAG: PilZ domain-containing protein [Desulfobacteraceae bacterium]|nr:MAG: PilZ domain-containing protein [Desulfobacteraceae bacterium]